MSTTTTVKSGAWREDASDCRSAFHYVMRPTARKGTLGIRIGLDAAQPQCTVKSGSCFSDWRYTRSAYRSPNQKGDYYFLGLRLGLDPVQPQHIILRGGSWISAGHRVRSAYRDGYGPGLRARDTGLRLGLNSVQPPRVRRGGSWLSYARYVRSAYRTCSLPVLHIHFLGLRLAMSVE